MKHLRITVAILLTGASIVLLWGGLASLGWRIVHDSPIMLYIAFMMDKHGAAPYVDIFDINLPGTYLITCLFAKVYGYSDIAFRIWDLLWLATISIVTFSWMRPMGKLPAAFATIGFPLCYLSEGPELSFQREYIALLPFALALKCAMSKPEATPKARAFAVGLLTGIAMTIKPHFFFPSLPALWAAVGAGRDGAVRGRAVSLLWGLALPLLAMLGYLVSTHSLSAFLDIAINYWPLYTHMTGDHTPISGFSRLEYIIASTIKEFWSAPYLMAAIVGLWVASKDATMAWRTRTVAWTLCLASIYPSFSGQFWTYHWFPFHYMAICVAGLGLGALREEKVGASVALPVLAAMLLLVGLSYYQIDRNAWTARNENVVNYLKSGVPDQIAAFLEKNMKEGDLVQPLDWTGGAVHGMLMARAKLATRFVYDFHFYHHVSSPYIQGLRAEFTQEMNLKKPRFVIEILQRKPSPKGPDTSTEFPELRAFLSENYRVVQENSMHMIYERTR